MQMMHRAGMSSRGRGIASREITGVYAVC